MYYTYIHVVCYKLEPSYLRDNYIVKFILLINIIKLYKDECFINYKYGKLSTFEDIRLYIFYISINVLFIYIGTYINKIGI